MFARMTSDTPSVMRAAIRQWTLSLACLLAGAGIAMTAENFHPSAADCAARDLKLMTLIESHGEAQDVASKQLAAAAFIMLQARQSCAQGRFAEGLARYESVVLAPGLAQAAR